MRNTVLGLLVFSLLTIMSCKKDDESSSSVVGSYKIDNVSSSINEADWFSYGSFYYIMLYSYSNSDTCSLEFVLPSNAVGTYTQPNSGAFYTNATYVSYVSSAGAQSQFTLNILRHNGDTIVGTYSAILAKRSTVTTADSSYLTITDGTFKAMYNNSYEKK